MLYLQEPQRNRHNRAHRNWGILQAWNMAASNMRTIPSYMGFINANPFGHHYYCSSFPPLAYCIIENHISGVSYCCGATAHNHILYYVSLVWNSFLRGSYSMPMQTSTECFVSSLDHHHQNKIKPLSLFVVWLFLYHTFIETKGIYLLLFVYKNRNNEDDIGIQACL